MTRVQGTKVYRPINCRELLD